MGPFSEDRAAAIAEYVSVPEDVTTCVAAAVLCVEYQRKVKQVCFKHGKAAVGAEHMQYIFRCGIFRNGLMYKEAAAVKIILFRLIAVYRNKREQSDKLQRLPQYVWQGYIVGVVVV